MAYNEKLTKRVREVFNGVPHVKEKIMFSGITFMVNDKMCVSVGDDRIMLRVNPALHDTLIKKQGVAPMTMKGREYKGYILVKEDALPGKKELAYWISLALEFNQFAKASKKRTKPN